MDEYIGRFALISAMEQKKYDAGKDGFSIMALIGTQPAADVVPKSLYDQTAWERDLAIQQLREDYGVGLGEKKKDVAPVRHGRWEDKPNPQWRAYDIRYCSACGWSIHKSKLRKSDLNWEYCPNCGAKMESEG